MTMYYVMAPDSVTEKNPTWARSGPMTGNLITAHKRAHRECGRVYGTDANTPHLVADYYQEPAPVTKLPPREYRQAKALATLFGITA